MAADAIGNVYVIHGHGNLYYHVRKVDASGVVTTLATAEVGGPLSALAVDGSGNVYVGAEDTRRGGSRIWKIRPDDGEIEAIAGTGEPGFKGEGVPAAAARLSSAYGIAVDTRGNLWFADSGNGLVRALDPIRNGVVP